MSQRARIVVVAMLFATGTGSTTAYADRTPVLLSRNWQNGRLWWNDPDCAGLTGNLPESARLLLYEPMAP